MFGYIRIRKEDLRVKDYHLYKKKYCSLCRYLGKNYGLIYRMITNYDVLFLMLSLENYERIMKTIQFRYPLNLLKKINISISDSVAEYCAFINYYMVVLKLEDDVFDEKSFCKKLLLKIFAGNKKYKNMKKLYGESLNKVSIIMDQVNDLEKEHASFDVLTNTFGTFFVSDE